MAVVLLSPTVSHGIEVTSFRGLHFNTAGNSSRGLYSWRLKLDSLKIIEADKVTGPRFIFIAFGNKNSITFSSETLCLFV